MISRREIWITAIAFFLLSYSLLFLGMPRQAEPYDEGLLLTGAMRVAAGQVPHRDFYTIYGPADFYLPAALFKVFGQSVFATRLLELLVEALTVAATYVIASFYCRRKVAVVAALVPLLWFNGWNVYICASQFPFTLLCIVSTVLLVPLFARPISRKRLCAAGTLAGLSALYRYDMGLALFAIQVCFMAIATYASPAGGTRRTARFLSALWPYLLGFSILTLPAAVYFLSVSHFYPLLRDVVILQAQNYQRGRHTPFPGVHLKQLDALAVYLPILTLALSLFGLKTNALRSDPNNPERSHAHSEYAERKGLFIAFSLLAFIMFFKAWIRVGPSPMFASLLPSVLMTAVLFEYRGNLPRFARIVTNCLVGFFLFTAAFTTARGVAHVVVHGSVPGRIARVFFSPNRSAGQQESNWCGLPNAMTRGFCFTSDAGRLRTIEFIDDHTTPDQRLYVGVTRHDKIYANDNLTYFASHRLPATRWSHFDPDLQNSYPIQVEMVREFDTTRPPYIVLDAEFDSMHEANDSSRSSGVTLLDDYIHTKYRLVQTFDEMSIWKRMP